MSTAPMAAVSEVADVNPKPERVPDDLEHVAFIGMSDLDEVNGVAVDRETRTYAEVSKGYTPFRRGDLLMAKITPCFQNAKIGQATTSTEFAAGSTEFHVIRPQPQELDDRYLLHFLRQPRVLKLGELRMTGSGGQRRVPVRFLDELQIPVPPIEEQRRIAAVLDTADELRNKRRQVLAKLDALTQSIFIDMFGDPHGSTSAWDQVQLDELLRRIDSGKSPVCLNRAAKDGEWGVLKAGAVTYSVFDASANKALPDSDDADPRHEIQAGDVLFARKNTHDLVAACAYVWETPPQRLMSDLIFRLVIEDPEVLNGVFLQAQLTHARTRLRIQRLAGGSAGSMPNISKARLRTVEVALPPINLQRSFEERVTEVRRQVAWLRTDSEHLDELFVSLQQRAFRGEL